MIKRIILVVLLAITFGQGAFCQQTNRRPDPKGAFVRSLVLPGWGHYYNNHSNWTRGKVHLAAEALLILSYAGLRIYSNNLEQDWYSYGRSETGVNIKGRSRAFQLAVGKFNNLKDYNDYQERSRNWNSLYADTPKNRWEWDSTGKRDKYSHIRSRFEGINQQLPAILVLMGLNRIISGISAFNRAKKAKEHHSFSSIVYLSQYKLGSGVMANLKLHF